MMRGDIPLEAVRRAETLLGQPARLALTQEISPEEMAMVRASMRGGERAHDVTLYIFAAAPCERLAVIAKHSYPPGGYRPPGGAVKPGEELAEGAAREALEETGLTVAVRRYALRVQARFTCARQEPITWITHVVTAWAEHAPENLTPLDTAEVREARWSTVAKLQGPIRATLLDTGRGLFAYRVALHDVMAALLAPPV